MADPRSEPADAEDALAAYKAVLRDLVNLRPSGTRQRIATALGTHKSFVSQITNPSLKVPVPAQHIETIFRICRFTADERTLFLDRYRLAHPEPPVPVADGGGQGEIRIPLPPFSRDETRREVESIIRDFADRVIALAKDPA